MMLCSVGIIIPNYNNSQYIGRCLESCIAQTFRNLEIIVVDDCSDDKSVTVIKEFQKKDSRIKLVQSTRNQGVSKTKHIGMVSCSAAWVTTLDSDDFYISKKKIEKEVEVLKKHEFCANVIAWSQVVLVNECGTRKKNIMDMQEVREGDIFESILTRSCVIPRDFIFSKNLYFEEGGFDFEIPLYEDWDLKIRLAKKANFYFTNSLGTAYRQHNTGLSSVNKEKHIKWLEYVFDKNTGSLESKALLKRELMNNVNGSFLVRLKQKIKKVLF